MELILAVEIDETDAKLMRGGPVEAALHRTVGALAGVSIKDVLVPETGSATAEEPARESDRSYVPVLRKAQSA